MGRNASSLLTPAAGSLGPLVEDLRRKNADLLVANDVSRPDGGFASDHNAAVLIDPVIAAGESRCCPCTALIVRKSQAP